jgi:hypothetical protein
VHWTEKLPDEVVADFDALLDRLMPLAQERLASEGVCWPVASAFDRKGVATDLIDPADGPRSVRDRLDMVYETLGDRADWLRSVGIAADVTALGVDNLRVTVEHRDGATFDIFLPYTRSRFRKKVLFGEVRIVSAYPAVWDDGSARM